MALIGRILVARWLVVVIALTSSLMGGLIVILVSPARYDAKARVTLNFIKPDPITGVVVNSRRVNAYVQSQVQMIHDVQVTGPAVTASGWLENPELIAAYDARPAGDSRDRATWAAERIIPGIQTYMVQDSNIMEIRFRALSPQTAKAIVSAVRDAYIDASVRERRTSALNQAKALQEQADKAKAEILRLQAEKGAYEKKTGVILQEDDVDLDTLQMQALAPALRTPKFRYSATSSVPAVNLARLDAQIADAAAVLGPNHPQLSALKQNRALVATTVAMQASGSDAQADYAEMQQRSRSARFDSQKLKVVDQRDEVLHLRLLQDQIDEQRTAFYNATGSAGKMRELSTMVESGISMFGEPVSIGRPAFPNKPLIMGGAGVFGLLGGVALAILAEMFNFRVRTSSGLRVAVPGPLLGQLPTFRHAPLRPASRARMRGALRRTQTVAAE
jgi:polysaccharide biosynthesis transport protein